MPTAPPAVPVSDASFSRASYLAAVGCGNKVLHDVAAAMPGTVRLVGTNAELIVEEVTRLLHDDETYQAMSRAHNPYGDGQACGRILHALKNNRVSL